MKARKPWTTDELDIMRKHFPSKTAEEILKLLPHRSLSSIYQAAKVYAIKKEPGFASRISKQRWAEGAMEACKATWKKKGDVPFNKGKKWDDYISQDVQKKLLKTTFKKHQQPHNTLHDGAIVWRQESGNTNRSYQWIRTAKGKWELLSRNVWRKAHGKIPKNHIVVFKDGDAANCSIENLECISMVEIMRRNTIHQYPAELAAVIKLKNKINKKLKQS